MHNTIWKEASGALRMMLSAEMFNRWFAPIQSVDYREGTLFLAVPNEFSRIWLQDNFLPLVREAVTKAAKAPTNVQFVVAERCPKSAEVALAPQPLGTAPATASATSCSSRLNPRYTFDAFVVGPNNHHAHAAALAVAQAPGRAYNPLFLYGGVGLGKTHLMQAIGHYVADHGKQRKVCYITCEEFTNDFIVAIENRTLTKFRRKYRLADVLLIDDVQFLSGKERMQEEFFHTFNSLFDAHKQIVLSSDRPASEIANLEQRLLSRFEWGLVADLLPPALETRIAILRKKAASLQVSLPDPVLVFLAEKIKTNIRRLEGALIRVASFATFLGKDLSVETVEPLLKDVLYEEARRTLSVELIQKKVAEHFDVRLADMTGHRRPANIALPRQIAMFLCRELTNRSLTEIGDAFGGRDHGTVLYAWRQISDAVKKDLRLSQTVSFLREALLREQRV